MLSQTCIGVSASQKEACKLSTLYQLKGVYVGGYFNHGKEATASSAKFDEFERN